MLVLGTPNLCLAQLSSVRLHPAIDGKRCRDPQSNLRRALGNPVEEEEEALWEAEGPRAPWENIQSQLTWPHGFSQRLKSPTREFAWD